jgi:hypothetical protein
LNRRERRASIRESAKSQRKSRKLNWDKVKSFTRFILLLWFGISLFIFSILLYQTVNRDSIRDTVLKNPAETEAVITKITSSARSTGNHGEFEFFVSNKKYFGTTFNNYLGQIGDKICIKYLIAKPEHNMYCNDLVYESIKEDVIFSSFKICLLIFAGTILVFIFWAIFNYKAFIKEFS